MAFFSPLESGDVAAIAAAFGIGAVHHWEPMAAGTINTIVSLHAGAGHFCLRINEGKSVTEVRYEAELIAHLAAAGVPVPVPMPGPDGEPFMTHEGRLASLFPWVDGLHRQPPDIAPVHARAVGTALARMHVAGLPVASRFERAGDYTFDHICARVAAIDQTTQAQTTQARDDARLAAALALVHDEIAWLRARAPVRAAGLRGVIHGDLFPDNVLFAGDDIAALIDFEQASTGSLSYDLAVCINAWCFDRDFKPDLIRAMIAGYQAVRALLPDERRALTVEVRAAAMRFTVTRITDVYLAGQDKPDKDFGLFARRLERWREIGAKELLCRGGLEE